MSEVLEKHECHVYHDLMFPRGRHHAQFNYPVGPSTTSLIHICDWFDGKGVGANLQQVRDLHTFFAQLEEEMVRRMPVPAPAVEAAPIEDPSKDIIRPSILPNAIVLGTMVDWLCLNCGLAWDEGAPAPFQASNGKCGNYHDKRF